MNLHQTRSEFVSSNGVHCKARIYTCFIHKNGTEMHEAVTRRIGA